MQRHLQDEWMDDPDLSPELHLAALRGLTRLNTLTAVAGPMYRYIRDAARRNDGHVRLLDVASGSGDLPLAWAKRARRDGIQLSITTVDISDVAVRVQKERAEAAGIEMETLQRDCLSEGLPDGFDICTNSLFFHHLEDEDGIRLAKSMAAAADQFLACDLERARINWLLVMIGARLATRSPVVHVDARRSIEGAYSKSEFAALLRRALGHDVPVRRVLPCRMIASITRRQLEAAA
ncbi:MAG: methyltransferase domain-containing protein [Planctomycetota bacterium]